MNSLPGIWLGCYLHTLVLNVAGGTGNIKRRLLGDRVSHTFQNWASIPSAIVAQMGAPSWIYSDDHNIFIMAILIGYNGWAMGHMESRLYRLDSVTAGVGSFTLIDSTILYPGNTTINAFVGYYSTYPVLESKQYSDFFYNEVGNSVFSRTATNTVNLHAGAIVDVLGTTAGYDGSDYTGYYGATPKHPSTTVDAYKFDVQWVAEKNIAISDPYSPPLFGASHFQVQVHSSETITTNCGMGITFVDTNTTLSITPGGQKHPSAASQLWKRSDSQIAWPVAYDGCAKHALFLGRVVNYPITYDVATAISVSDAAAGATITDGYWDGTSVQAPVQPCVSTLNSAHRLVGVWGNNEGFIYTTVNGTLATTPSSFDYTGFFVVKASDTTHAHKYSIFSRLVGGGKILHIENIEGVKPELWLDDTFLRYLDGRPVKGQLWPRTRTVQCSRGTRGQLWPRTR
jgi:hypothetical protein